MLAYDAVYSFVSFFIGISLAFLLLGAQVAAINHLDPHIALTTFAVANICYAMVSNNVGRVGIKFASFAALFGFLITIASLILSIFVANDSSYWSATIWAFGSYFSQPLFRWIAQELANRHTNVVDNLKLNRKISQSLELGYILPFVLALSEVCQPSARGSLWLAALALSIASFIILINFSVRRKVELPLSSREPPDFVNINSSFKHLLFATACFLFAIGTFRLFLEYAVRVQIQGMSNSFEDNQKLIGLIYVLSGIGAFMLNQLRGKKLSKYSPSAVKIAILGLVIMFLVAISLRKNITGFFVGLAAMEVIARALDRSAFAHILYATGNTVRGHKKAAFRYLQQSMQFILPAILVFLITNKIKSEFFREMHLDLKLSLMGVIVASIATLLFFTMRLDGFLRAMLSEDSKENKTRAILGLEMLQPADFELVLEKILNSSPKKIVAKTAINALSTVHSESSVKLILDQFANGREEIQLAVIQAIRGVRSPTAINFLWRASTGNVGSIAMKARFEATDAMSEIYGAGIVPIIMEGLKDSDDRVVANTIDVLAQFYDKRLVQIFCEFANHPVPRIQANSLLALRKYSKSEKAWRNMMIDRFEKSSQNILPSLLYAMGKSGDRGFCEYIRRLAAKVENVENVSIVERGVAIALISLLDKKGYELFFNIITRKVLNRDVEDAIILFGGVNNEARILTIEYLVEEHARSPRRLGILYSRLKASPLDLHFELALLKAVVKLDEVDEIDKSETAQNVAA